MEGVFYHHQAVVLCMVGSVAAGCELNRLDRYGDYVIAAVVPPQVAVSERRCLISLVASLSSLRGRQLTTAIGNDPRSIDQPAVAATVSTTAEGTLSRSA